MFFVFILYRKVVTNSVAYMMMERLGIDTEEYFEREDFEDIINFNTPGTLNALGFATSDIAEMGLTEIAKTVMSLERQNRIIAENRKPDYNILGQLDSTVRDGDAETYADCAVKLKRLENNPDYGYIFKTLRTLCEVLSVKYDIGVCTRKAYEGKDTAALKNIIADYDRLIVLIDAFYGAFKEQWEKENKPNGFEVQDIRIGGLRLRVQHCRERLEAFSEGKIPSLPELDEPILDFHGAEKAFNCSPIGFNNWGASASVDL